MNGSMKARVLCDVRWLDVRDVPRPAISPYEVLVRVAAVGLCGTGAHISRLPIADCQLPIGALRNYPLTTEEPSSAAKIGNWQSAIGNQSPSS